MIHERVFDRLRQAAAELTGDPVVQKELMQEMYAHLLDIRTNMPAMPTDWYIRTCAKYAHDYLRRVHPKPLKPDKCSVAAVGDAPCVTYQWSPLPVQLTARQQEAFERFRQGCGIRETARQLGISHVAVIKLRNNIARRLPDSIPATSLPSAFEGMHRREAVPQMA